MGIDSPCTTAPSQWTKGERAVDVLKNILTFFRYSLVIHVHRLYYLGPPFIRHSSQFSTALRVPWKTILIFHITAFIHIK